MSGDLGRLAATYRCQNCGMESSVREAFVASSRLLGRPVTLCFECEMRRSTQLLGAELLVFPAAGLLLFWLAPGSWLAQFAGVCASVIVLCIPLSLLHELAHVAVGQLLGFHVFSVHLGLGRAIYVRRFYGIQWALHLVPAGGLTILAAPALPSYRARAFCAYLAGPALHAAMATGMLVYAPFVHAHGTAVLLEQLWYTTIAINVVLLVSNLLPRKISTPAGVSGTDGWALLWILLWNAAEIRSRQAAYYILQARDAFERHDLPAAGVWVARGLEVYPQDAQLLNTAGVIYNHTGELEKARQAYLRVLATTGLPAGLKYIAMNNVAYVDLLLGDPALLAEADEYSALAVRNSPWNAALLGTRGAVLVELGEVETGLELLNTALDKATNRRSKAEHACGIALGELKLGRPAQAGKYLQAARQLDPRCLLLDRLDKQLQASAVPAASIPVRD